MDLPVNYHNLTWQERKVVRLEYIKLQDNKCLHCGELLSDNPPKEIMDLPVDVSIFPIGFFNHPVHLHHDHNTGETKGAVHCRCNAVLWLYFNE